MLSVLLFLLSFVLLVRNDVVGQLLDASRPLLQGSEVSLTRGVLRRLRLHDLHLLWRLAAEDAPGLVGLALLGLGLRF